MQATILDGKVLAAELRAEIARETAEFKRQSGA